MTRIALFVVGCMVLSAGCGGSGTSSARELEQSVVLARDRTDYALERVTDADSRGELLARMDEAADTIEDAAGDLDRVGAPERYGGSIDDLVAALSQLGVDIQATADQIRQPGFGDLLTGIRGLSFESWDRANRALAALGRRGITVAPLERH
jgi:hypothetical protein